jgi:hypothetical protein
MIIDVFSCIVIDVTESEKQAIIGKMMQDFPGFRLAVKPFRR